MAVTFPEDVLAGAADVLRRLQTGCNFVGARPAWVRAETLHQTLVFLGWQDPERLDDAVEAMRAGVARLPGSIRLTLSGVDFFPSQRDPRVVALGMHGDIQKLIDLQAALAEECRSRGFDLENRPFRPHVTLARIKAQKGLPGLKKVVAGHRAVRAGRFTADRVVLFRSILDPDGARHIRLAEALLAAEETPAAPSPPPSDQ